MFSKPTVTSTQTEDGGLGPPVKGVSQQTSAVAEWAELLLCSPPYINDDLSWQMNKGTNQLLLLYNNNNHNNICIQRRDSRFLQFPYCGTNHLQHVLSSGPGAIVCKSHATHQVVITCNMLCYEPRGMKGQLSY